jgi:hypothetical protein
VLASGVLGWVVSYIRLGRRFPDAPLLAALTFPGIVYQGANAAISAGVYLVLQASRVPADPMSVPGMAMIAFAGIAAPLFLQSELAAIRVGYLTVDPGAVLNDFFVYIHSAVDRSRARKRLSSMALDGLDFDRDCVPLAELVSNALRMPDPGRDDPAALGSQMGELSRRDDLPDGVKLQVLEAELAKLAGPRVVTVAAVVLRKMREEECRAGAGHDQVDLREPQR